MATLGYTVICSLDGYLADAKGNFDWAAPDEQVHAFVNDLQRDVGTYLFGSRMYATMRFWEDPHLRESDSAAMREFATLWQAADKIVYSASLDQVSTARTRLERSFDPAAVRRLLAGLDSEASIGGPTLAAAALRAGLVTDCHVFQVPVTVGGGLRVWPTDLQTRLALRAERSFDSGVRYAHYCVTTE